MKRARYFQAGCATLAITPCLLLLLAWIFGIPNAVNPFVPDEVDGIAIPDELTIEHSLQDYALIDFGVMVELSGEPEAITAFTDKLTRRWSLEVTDRPRSQFVPNNNFWFPDDLHKWPIQLCRSRPEYHSVWVDESGTRMIVEWGAD